MIYTWRELHVRSWENNGDLRQSFSWKLFRGHWSRCQLREWTRSKDYVFSETITWHYWPIGNYWPFSLYRITTPNLKEKESAMNDGRNFFIWLIFMVAIFIILGVLETALEVPDIGWRSLLLVLGGFLQSDPCFRWTRSKIFNGLPRGFCRF